MHELKQLRKDTEYTEVWTESFEHQLERTLSREVKLAQAQNVKSVRDEGCQTASQTVVNSTSDLRKRPREPTVSLQDTAAKKPKVNMHKASTKEVEWV